MENKKNRGALKILDGITEDDKHYVLEVLIKRDKEFSNTIEQIVRERMSNVDREAIAKDVLENLEGLDYNEFLERLEGTPDISWEEGEIVDEMIEEALYYHYQALQQLQKLDMWGPAKEYCLGMLLGIFRRIQGEENEFDKVCPGTPDMRFSRLCEDWREQCEDAKVLGEFEAEYPQLFGDYEGW